MTEPITTNRSLIIPNTGDLSGAWGTSALNPNFQTIDAMFGGVTTISLSSATTLLLTVPATTGVWPGALSQSVNSLIKFTGAQSGNAIIQVTLPGYYIINNLCTGTSYVQLAPVSGGGNSIGAPPGKKCHVFFDGTDMDYVNMPDPGSAYDLHTNTTALPPWMQACTKAPYLVKNGATYSSSLYPALAQLLGSTYGGNGITTFGVPDESARYRLPIDWSGTGRVTSAVSGVQATTWGASGGSQLLHAHSHVATAIISDPGHVHASLSNSSANSGNGPAFAGNSSSPGTTFNTASATTNVSAAITVANSGTGASQNIPPTIVDFLPLIKT